MNKALKTAGALLCGGALVSCADTTVRMGDSTWLVTNIYLFPGDENVVSDLVATQPSIDFGRTSVTGFTGCVPFQGRVSFDDGGQRGDINRADHITFSELTFDELPEDCLGQERLIHEDLVALLPEAFELSHRSDTEILLTSDVDALDRPSIRLVSWVSPNS
ncbi:hypothetical protein [Corynebacterium pacaense]|uniref:hypothetical protein n=1 Tax=Corynebacterium pacaense TaxID=1816684 RepID=UPI0009BB153A|nr:hypothetical protein [Corynebacterium pacaense]